MGSLFGSRSGAPGSAASGAAWAGRRRRAVLAAGLAAVLAVPSVAGAAEASWGRLEVASLTSAGVPGGRSIQPAVSGDGRYVVFESDLDLVAGDRPGNSDLYLRDRLEGRTRKLLRPHRDQGGLRRQAVEPAISADGSTVAFVSDSNSLVPGDTNRRGTDVFVLEVASGRIERVTAGITEATASPFASTPALSADGRYVAYGSQATGLVPGDDVPYSGDAFVYDRATGLTERVSVSSSGQAAPPRPGYITGVPIDYGAAISADGRSVAFTTRDALVPEDTNDAFDIYLRDRQAGTTERVSVSSAGEQGDEDSLDQALSADGRVVAFSSEATNLVEGDTNGERDVFVHDRRGPGRTVRVSVASDGTQGFDAGFATTSRPDISGNGRYVCFMSGFTQLVPGDSNDAGLLDGDVFLHDRHTRTTVRLTVRQDGTEGPATERGLGGGLCSLDGDGSVVAFNTSDPLAADDTNGASDVYVRQRRH